MSDGVDLPANAPWWAVGLAAAPWLYRVGRWLLGHADRREKRRQDRLDAEEEDLGRSWSAYRKRIEARLTEVEAQAAQRQRENNALRVAFELVAAPLRVLDPGNFQLKQAEQMLAAVFPLDPQIPLEMTMMVSSLGRAPGAGAA